jgi:hypothetical protein
MNRPQLARQRVDLSYPCMHGVGPDTKGLRVYALEFPPMSSFAHVRLRVCLAWLCSTPEQLYSKTLGGAALLQSLDCFS